MYDFQGLPNEEISKSKIFDTVFAIEKFWKHI
jgi:hypothetical protein